MYAWSLDGSLPELPKKPAAEPDLPFLGGMVGNSQLGISTAKLLDIRKRLRPIIPPKFCDNPRKTTNDSNASGPRDPSLSLSNDVQEPAAKVNNNRNNNTPLKNRPLPKPTGTPVKGHEPIPTQNPVPQPPLPRQKSWTGTDKGDSGRGSWSSDSSMDAQNSVRTNPTQRECYLDLTALKQPMKKYNDDYYPH